jgi:hypothetical protein
MDDSRLGGANYRKALIVCQRMQRASAFCQVCDSRCAIINPKDGMWLARPFRNLEMTLSNLGRAIT